MPKPRLIVIDDELDMAALIAEIGELVGYEVDVVTNAAQFRQAITNHTYNVIAMDIFMPDTDGIELIGELADQNNNAATILVSGKGEELLHNAEILATKRGLNLCATIKKPFDLNTMASILRTATTTTQACC